MPRKNSFTAANILLPEKDFDKWAVIACDQFTSQKEYWLETKKIANGHYSAFDLILPEAFLSDDNSEYVNKINSNMQEYIKKGVFREYKSSMIFVERKLPDGAVRYGIVGAIDLEEYDYSKGSQSSVRATEATVIERIPPRVAIRKNAPLELPHIMVLIDDINRTVIEPLKNQNKELIYDTELMLGGGSIRGYLMSDEQIKLVEDALNKLGEAVGDNGILFAVGDGNHSLATAKECYRQNPNSKNRYALCEIVNIHDEAIVFEPIYRVLFNVDTNDVQTEAMKSLRGEKHGRMIAGDKEIDYTYNGLAAKTVGDFIDAYLCRHKEASVDYVHGEEYARELAKAPDTCAFIFDGMDKSELFPYVESHGSLPRKTFSMGEAESKRYYMEARIIK